MKIRYLICDSTIESKHTHNTVTCKCDNCYIDGGKDFSKILIIFDDGIEILSSDEENYRKKYNELESKKYNT